MNESSKVHFSKYNSFSLLCIPIFSPLFSDTHYFLSILFIGLELQKLKKFRKVQDGHIRPAFGGPQPCISPNLQETVHIIYDENPAYNNKKNREYDIK